MINLYGIFKFLYILTIGSERKISISPDKKGITLLKSNINKYIHMILFFSLKGLQRPNTASSSRQRSENSNRKHSVKGSFVYLINIYILNY